MLPERPPCPTEAAAPFRRFGAVRAALLLSLGGCAHAAIIGTVVDRNGAPVPRASVTMAPGDVNLVTDDQGRFEIEYVHDDERRVRVQGHRDYTVEVFKPGFHVLTKDFFYGRGAFDFGQVELVEDTIEVRQMELELDAALFANPTHAAGANYEGQ